MTEQETKASVIAILEEQNKLLDTILDGQSKIREAVRQKQWPELEKNMTVIQTCSEQFISLDTSRNELLDGKTITEVTGEEPVLAQVRGKLVKSKIENKALNDYIKITRGFLQTVLDKVVPQRRNTLYTKKGSIIKPQPESVVIDQLM